MKHNKIKIISNQTIGILSYFIMNENEEWVHVDGASPLSKIEFTHALLFDKAEQIIAIIDDVYNVGNRGVDIELECSDKEYHYFISILQTKKTDLSIQAEKIANNRSEEDGVKRNDTEIYLNSKKKQTAKNRPNKNTPKQLVSSTKKASTSNEEETSLYSEMSCKKRGTYVVVAGKVKSGKSMLIEALGEFNSARLSVTQQPNCKVYMDERKDQKWYEIEGIDLGKEYVQKAKMEIERIAFEGMTVFMYCFSTNKIEDAEIQLILELKRNYPNTRFLCVLTSCIDDDAYDTAERMSSYLDGIKVIPALAKEKKIKQGMVSAYGLDDITKYLYGGK